MTISSNFFLHITYSIILGIIIGYNIGKFSNSTVELELRRLTNTYYLIPGKTRNDFGRILNELGLKTGAELGVFRGEFSEMLLTNWKKCEKYYLVDLWMPIKNYKDGCNQDQKHQNASMDSAKERLENWKDKTVFYRMRTTEAAELFQDESLDFVYVDARHDYCAAKEDIELYWTKVKRGGILAGHDYMDNAEMQSKVPDQDWSVCENGDIHPGAVKQAVNDFVMKENLVLSVMYREKFSNSWMVRKPF